MGSWDGTKLGLKIKPKDQELAEQFLQCIGVDTNDYIVEEVEELSSSFTPEIEGKVNGKLLGIMPALNTYFSDYVQQFYGDYDEEYGDEFEEEFDEEEHDEVCNDDQPIFDFTLDDLYCLVNRLFSPAYLYLAHEDGNNTSDDYYRHEEIYNPKTKYCTKKDRFYSYSEGINIDGDDEEGVETKTMEIVIREPNEAVVDWLIQKAKSFGYDGLAQKLSACK